MSVGFGEVVDAGIIAAILLGSVTLNVAQTHRSNRAAEALRRSVAPSACVVRDGHPRTIPATQVLPGDVLALSAGDMIPADARLLEAKDLFTDQAALTGESLPAEKHARDLPGGAHSLDQAVNAVFAGTSVISGTGRAVVVLTGGDTAFGGITASLAAGPPPTEFERGMAAFSFLILQLVVGLVLFVFLVLSLVRHQPFEAFMFALALAVGLTPEFLPMILTITLSRGAQHMAAERVIVKQLQAIENFGSIDVLCTDKTGTLTEGTLALTCAVEGRGRPSDEALQAAALNSHFETGIRSPLDAAIVAAVPAPPPGWTKLDEIPFDFHRRRLSVVLERADARVMIVKGAPENVLAACDDCQDGGPDWREAADATAQRLSEAGLRVLAIARKPVASKGPFEPADERGLTLVGFVAFTDRPRESVRPVLEALRRDGIRLVMLAGDNEWVTRRVCDAVGLDTSRLMLGSELDAVRDEALPRVVADVDVFARLTPEQKTRVLFALKQAGHVVGYLGDGINDAPALRMADVGISVNTAVEVAKDAAAIILLDKELSTLHQGVLEGRRSFANVMKYLMMNVSSNFGNMLSMAAASLLLPFLPMLPMQILLNNLLYDLSQVAIPSDRVDKEDIEKPRRWRVDVLRRFMTVMGPVSSLFDLLLFAVLLLAFRADAALFRTVWFMESLVTQALVIGVIRTRGNPLKSRPSRPLAVAVVAVSAVAIALPYTPLGPLFGFVAPPGWMLGVIAAFVIAYLAMAEGVKRLFYRRQAR
ncbi:Magnesium-transporting ATPase, P-type 1 [compost metagenome]